MAEPDHDRTADMNTRAERAAVAQPGATLDQPNLVMAGTIIAVLPIVIVLLVFQRQLVRGLTAGGGQGMSAAAPVGAVADAGARRAVGRCRVRAGKSASQADPRRRQRRRHRRRRRRRPRGAAAVDAPHPAATRAADTTPADDRAPRPRRRSPTCPPCPVDALDERRRRRSTSRSGTALGDDLEDIADRA